VDGASSLARRNGGSISFNLPSHCAVLNPIDARIYGNIGENAIILIMLVTSQADRGV